MMSLHWALAQFAGGMDEVTPDTTHERIFAAIVFMFCFIMAAVIIAQLTSAMTKLEIISSSQAQQLAALKRYLSQNKISKELGLRVQRNALHAAAERARLIPECQVQMLELVSEPLLL